MELRRSPMRWWLLILVALDLATLFGRSTWWIGEWPQTSAQVQIPAFYFAPVLAAGAAWSSGRAARNNFQPQLAAAARPQWQVEMCQLLATLSYGLAAYLVGIIAAVSVSYSSAGPGFIWPDYVLLGIALLTLFAGAGHLVGRLSKSQFLGPTLMGLSGLIVIAWIGAPHNLGLFVISGDPYKSISMPALIMRCLLAAAVAVTACLLRRPLYAPGKHRSIGGFGVPRVASLGVVVCACLASLTIAGPIQITRGPSREPLCTSGTPTVCLWPEDRKYLPDAQKMANRMRDLPKGFFKVPSEFHERGLRKGAQPASEFYIMEGSMWDPAATMAGSIVSASWPSGNGCTLPDGPRLTREFRNATSELNVWLTMRIFGGGVPSGIHGGPPVNLQTIARVTQQPGEEQSKWTSSRIDIIHHAFCG
ncbi:DUF7224 domain-containing protein [Streptomyces sp. NPDC002536]